MNSVVNYKVNISPIKDPRIATELFFEIAKKHESETYIAIPNEVLSTENLNISLNVGAVMIAKTWGLENHSETPNMRSINELLCRRFALKEDDITHDQFFD